MKLKEIYELFIKLGMENDPRGGTELQRHLDKAKKAYDKLEKGEQKDFDLEALTNPYSDTRILFGAPEKEIKTIMAGIDMETPEVILADRLNEKGKKIDAIISHHPEGKAFANFSDVMHLQADLLSAYGVPINIAEGLMGGRISEVARAVAPANHQRPIDAARLLDIPFMCAHTVADNMVYAFLKNLMDDKKPETVGDILDVLKEIPEYKEGAINGAGPCIFAGSPERRTGKIAVTGITGGTEGAKEIYEKMAQAGIGTTIDMHMSEEHKKEAEKYHINVVIAGHMASDSIGFNLLLDELEKRGVEVIPVSGLIRVKR